jgi:hypothetical protein
MIRFVRCKEVTVKESIPRTLWCTTVKPSNMPPGWFTKLQPVESDDLVQ